MCSCLKRFLGTKFGPPIAWQVPSLDMCLIGSICTQMANRFDHTLPLMMLTLTYFFLLIGTVWFRPKSDTPWWKSIIFVIASVAGDYLCVEAYNYTSLSSAILLSTTTIFFVCPISFFVFKRKINWKQLIYMLLGGVGIVTVFVADGAGDSRWQGNLMALGGSLLYAIANVMQEVLVLDTELKAYLFRFSVIAFPIGCALTGGLEWKLIRDFKWCGESVAYILIYSVFLAVYYVISPMIMAYSTATEMTLSLLTSNFYSLAVSIAAFGQQFDWLYLAGFICIPVAIVGFTIMVDDPQPEEKPKSPINDSFVEPNEEEGEKKGVELKSNSEEEEACA